MKQSIGNIMMCGEITHKVLKTETYLQLLQDITQRSRQRYKEDFAKAVIGTVVLTDYNNKTYVISNINWNQLPQCTFDLNRLKSLCLHIIENVTTST